MPLPFGLKSGFSATIAAIAVAAVATTGAVPAVGDDAPGLPAEVSDYTPLVRLESYSVTHFGRSRSARDDRTTTAGFRVIEGTGNCCENYVTISSSGRLYDLGGRYINFTDDGGQTWKQVTPLEPLINGEGAIALAPGGDVVGVEWDPYSADHLLSYKYDAEAEQWQYLEMPLHTPFYDRPWLAVVPGPFSIRGEDVPYVVFVDGFPHRGTFLYSTDGLTYVETSNPFLDQRLGAAAKGWIKTGTGTDLDWISPNSQSPIIPLGGGSALAMPGPFANSWSVLHPATQKWSTLQLPEGKLEGRFLVDSKGRMHNLLTRGRLFEYRISIDGGQSWKSLMVNLPQGYTSTGGLQVDFRVNAAVGVAAVAIHAEGGQADLDLLYKIGISSNKPRLLSLYEIGLGDIDSSSGIAQSIRMDFQTVAIFPDGRLAVSFLDSSTGPDPAQDRLDPALAIEL